MIANYMLEYISFMKQIKQAQGIQYHISNKGLEVVAIINTFECMEMFMYAGKSSTLLIKDLVNLCNVLQL